VFGKPDLELRTLVALASQGWPVIMPDYAGFVEGSRVAGYTFAADEAYSLLDATFAMQKLLGDARSQVVMVGHSQGGHGVLSAQAYARSYGMAGRLSGVAAFAPFWAPARTFGVLLSQYPVDDMNNWYPVSNAIEYFYTHAEQYDGPGAGKGLVNMGNLPGQVPEAAVDALLTSCNFEPDLGQFPVSFVAADYADVALCAATGVFGCTNPASLIWAPRMAADRPALDPRGAPVVMWHGAGDLSVPTSIVRCATEKLEADFALPGATASFRFCGDEPADHETVESRNAAWVIQWIKARALGAAEPASCAPLAETDCIVGNYD
jgi:pimeloyl-ACP methyl ester carboxylesterase